MVEILKQNQYVPMDVEKQVSIIYAASKGYLDDLSVEQVSDFESGLFNYIQANVSDVLASIVSEGKITDETSAALDKAITEFKQGFTA